MPDAPGGRWRGWLRALPVLQGVLPVDRSRVPADMLAGLTLAALGIPEVLGYAKIAGMPLVTGLVHAAPADGGVRRPRLVPAPRRRRGFRDRGHPRRRAHRPGGGGISSVRPAGRAGGPAGRRDAAAGAAGPARFPGELPVPHRAGRVPGRRRHPGRGRAAARHARDNGRGQADPAPAAGHGARAPARAPVRRGHIDGGHRDRGRGPADHPPDPGAADRGGHRDHRELGR